MGIQGLSKLIADIAPFAIKEKEIKNFFGRKIAIDASELKYLFLLQHFSQSRLSFQACVYISSSSLYELKELS